jgi:hypothetical protein
MKRAVVGMIVVMSLGAGFAIWRHAGAQATAPTAAAPAAPAVAPAAGAPQAPLTAAEAADIGVAAYIFAYPLVTMQATEKVMTNVEKPRGDKAPVGQFANLRKFPTSSFRTVTAPNADTLYSSAWLDLSHEPYVFSYPEMGKRYFMFPILDAYTDVLRTPGQRDNGGAASTYVITGPDWKWTTPMPAGAVEIKSPTNTVWILGRIYCDTTPEDYQAVHALQDKLTLFPLSANGQNYTPPAGKVDPKVNEKVAVREQVDAMKVEDYFNAAARAMAKDPPTTFDATIVGRMARIGLRPGEPFDLKKLPPDAAAAFKDVPKTAQQKIMAQRDQGGANVKNGWVVLQRTGSYGLNYDQRAFVAAVGLGANKAEQAVYPTTDVDGQGQKLSGANKYVLHFAPRETPPVKAFWSLTMYDKKMFFVSNALNRYSINVPRDQLKQNDDGSLDIYIQNAKPDAEVVSNWLPAPKGDFVLMMRMYWPTEKTPSILDGSWQPPAVTRQIGAPPRMGRPSPAHKR